MFRRAQLVVDLKDGDAYDEFHAKLSGMGCPEEAVKEAWEVLKRESYGEYNTVTRRLTDPAFAHAFKVMTKRINAESPPPRRFEPLNPGEFAVEFEHRRLEPDKVNVWFRRGSA